MKCNKNFYDKTNLSFCDNYNKKWGDWDHSFTPDLTIFVKNTNQRFEKHFVGIITQRVFCIKSFPVKNFLSVRQKIFHYIFSNCADTGYWKHMVFILNPANHKSADDRCVLT